jgi:hypothetical protein
MTVFQLLMTGEHKSRSHVQEGGTPQEVCAHLERGGIVYFPQSPFSFPPEDLDFLLHQHQLENGFHKNIAYRPLKRKITGLKADSGVDIAKLTEIMQHYTDETVSLVESLLAPYRGFWKLDYASFRPIEEEGRKLRLRARNDLLHIDSFTTRAMNGNRILRVFTNISPTQTRFWKTSGTFEELAIQYQDVLKPFVDKSPAAFLDMFEPIARLLGLKALNRPAYDVWMLDFHNFLKENRSFQLQESHHDMWEFPPGSSWLVYTDMVSHAVLSGQYALEQTFIIDYQGMVLPEKAPISILRSLYSQDALPSMVSSAS